MSENKKKIKYVKCIIAIICCIIIFSFSAVPATASTKQSKGLTYNVIKLLNGNKLPPYTITDKMLNLATSIMEKIGEANYFESLNRFPELRRKTRIQ